MFSLESNWENVLFYKRVKTPLMYKLQYYPPLTSTRTTWHFQFCRTHWQVKCESSGSSTVTRPEHFPKSLWVRIDWRRYVVPVAARAGAVALFGYLCLRRNEFQLEYQSQCAHSYGHSHAGFLSDSVGLIWVYLFLKKANSAATCTVLQRNSLHFNTLFFFRSSKRMFPLEDAGAAHCTACLPLNLFFFPPSETETIHHCRVLSRDHIAQFLKCHSVFFLQSKELWLPIFKHFLKAFSHACAAVRQAKAHCAFVE